MNSVKQLTLVANSRPQSFLLSQPDGCPDWLSITIVPGKFGWFSCALASQPGVVAHQFNHLIQATGDWPKRIRMSLMEQEIMFHQETLHRVHKQLRKKVSVLRQLEEKNRAAA
ncbi:MAG: hypothetical protein HLUCCO02_05370 [Idiomarinaceae bacterium HL-53]|nr:MAG: hypothetical protein HLUCCO02_05370 [Idiomarinaceae bacterium HL-53]CUS47988.1 hypothetical protein Ga0003345_0927 [Idiomarinaceae bacterium HL-53]